MEFVTGFENTTQCDANSVHNPIFSRKCGAGQCLRADVTSMGGGRKNWLFFGNAGGGKTASILMTMTSSAHRHGLNEFEYLCDILSRLSDLGSESAIRDWLPDRWQPRKP